MSEWSAITCIQKNIEKMNILHKKYNDDYNAIEIENQKEEKVNE